MSDRTPGVRPKNMRPNDICWCVQYSTVQYSQWVTASGIVMSDLNTSVSPVSPALHYTGEPLLPAAWSNSKWCNVMDRIVTRPDPPPPTPYKLIPLPTTGSGQSTLHLSPLQSGHNTPRHPWTPLQPLHVTPSSFPPVSCLAPDFASWRGDLDN